MKVFKIDKWIEWKKSKDKLSDEDVKNLIYLNNMNEWNLIGVKQLEEEGHIILDEWCDYVYQTITKFRGKRVDNGEWVYGYYFTTPLTIENFGAGHLGDGIKRHCISTDMGVVYAVIPETVGQFTGLKDVADYDIYTGDIVRVYYNGYEETSVHEVRYMIDESYPAFDLVPIINFADSNSLQYAFIAYAIEVIGNIHDNPELLESNQNN